MVALSWRLLTGAARAPAGRRSGPKSSVGVRGSGWFGGFRCDTTSIGGNERPELAVGRGGDADFGRSGAIVG